MNPATFVAVSDPPDCADLMTVTRRHGSDGDMQSMICTRYGATLLRHLPGNDDVPAGITLCFSAHSETRYSGSGISPCAKAGLYVSPAFANICARFHQRIPDLVFEIEPDLRLIRHPHQLARHLLRQRHHSVPHDARTIEAFALDLGFLH